VTVGLRQLGDGEVAMPERGDVLLELLAPMSAAVTRGSRGVQASANCASVLRRRAAISLSARTS
jgi:hypothetical protein